MQSYIARPIISFALVLLSGLMLIVERAPAQGTSRVGGQAFSAYVSTPVANAQSPIAVLPDTGGMAEGQAQTFTVANTITSQGLDAISTGMADSPVSSSQSTSELESLTLLGGVITADAVTAIASSYVDGTGAASDALGSAFVNLVVNGTPITTDVAPNTQIALPGVGYVVLNEETSAGNGVTSSGITVNMIHVVLQNALTGANTGEIIVGSANSAVGF